MAEQSPLEPGGYGSPRFDGLVKPALLVVDMTNDFAHPDGVYPRHGAVCQTFPATLDAARFVLEAAAATGVPTVAISQVIYRDPAGDAVTGGGLVESRPWLMSEGLSPGSWGVQLVDGLPRCDYFLEKPRASAFFATALEVLLRGIGAETLIVVGCYTNQCIESTVRDAWARDFHVVVVTDAVTAFDERLHKAALDSMKPLSTQVSAREVAGLLRKTPHHEHAGAAS
jgi:ureidoacrylate peracid hydrolase